MIRYFISYNEVDKDNISNEKINILRRNKDKSFSVISLDKLDKSVIDNLHKLNDYKKNIFIMVELDKEEKNNYNDILIKEFKDKNGKLEFNQREISLMNYTNYLNLNDVLEKEDFIELYEEDDKINLVNVDNDEYFENRYQIIKQSILSDVYINIKDEDIIDKNKNDITVIQEKDIDDYELKQHKMFVIDSIPENIARGFVFDSMKIFYNICNNSIPAYLEEIDENKYDIKLKGNYNNGKKVYLMKNFDIKNVLYDTGLVSLLKYINLYIYEDGYYKVMNLEEYLKRENILKYIKKPN